MYGMTPDMHRIVTLYGRCMRYRVLPFPGGLADQPERVMAFFDVIHAEVKAHEREMLNRKGRR